MFGFKFRNDKRGLSLIELICALAVLGIITTTVGGAMAVATNSYRRGTVETALQQEAQFTTNNIESLIIDATTDVQWATAADGNNQLIIVNEDKSYAIKYDAANEQLLYSEYNATDVAGVIDANKIADASDVLLAEHVSGFSADPSNFAVARTVLLSLTLQNGASSYTSSYNVTSRNNVNIGDAPERSATFVVPSAIVLEPGENMVVNVQINGTSTDYTATMVADDDADTALTITSNGKGDKNPNDATNTKVTKQSDGIKVELGTMETGGADQIRKIHLATTVQDASGSAPLASAEITVLVRRVREVKITDTLVSGERGKKDSVYELTVTDDNFNYARSNPTAYLDKTTYQPDQINYVSPRSVKWEVHHDGAGLVTFLSDQSSNTVRFKLNDDLSSTTNLVKAVAQHPNGQNRTGIAYDGENVYDIFKIAVTESSDSGILRGKQAWLYPNGTLSAKQWVEQQLGTETDDPKKLITYVRIVSKDGTHKSDGYDTGKWFKVGDGGGLVGSAMYFNFREYDFTSTMPTYYTKEYTLETMYAVCYKDKGVNHLSWYPSTIPGLNDNSEDAPSVITGYNPTAADFSDPDKPYLKKYDLGATTAEVLAVAESVTTWTNPIAVSANNIDLAAGGYLSARGAGLGATNPITISKSNPYEIFGRITGATTDRAQSLFQNAKIINESTGAQANLKDLAQLNYAYSAEVTSSMNYFEIKLQNWSFDRDFFKYAAPGTVFKIVFDEMSGYNDGTNSGVEHYNQFIDPDLVTDGRGVFRFTVTN